MSKPRRALITGITGQDGSYLAELLLERGYQVHGLIRRASNTTTQRLDHLYEEPYVTPRRLLLHYGDMLDSQSLQRVVELAEPDEVYHLAAQSHVRVSFDMPVYTSDVDALGTMRLLEAVRQRAPQARFYQASTSELYGQAAQVPQDERTPFHPRSPYAVSKLYSFWAVVNYREAYGMHASNGILFNHESPRRGITFVTRKITRAAAQIACGLQQVLHLGNLDAERDWGYAPEYVEAMWRMLQQEQPDDYVIATGVKTTVRSFVEAAFAYVGKPLDWRGQGLEEVGVERGSGEVRVRIDPRYFRPSEVDLLLGDASKAERVLGWRATTKVEQLVALMVEHDLSLARREASHMVHDAQRG